MKYALLAYDLAGSLQELPADDKRVLHRGHAALQHAESRATVIAHFRFRPARLVTTVSLVGDELVERGGAASETSAELRALYLVESSDPDAVSDLARQLPAVQLGGTVEIWPLTEPAAGEQPTRHGHHLRRKH
jgi:hypothetical protein